MATGTYAVVMSIGGSTIKNTPISESGDHPNTYELSIPAAESGTLSTRTGDGAGVLTVTAHSISASDIIDIYWSGGARYGVTVDSVDANTITFDDTPAASGDVLPAQGTAITVDEQITVNTQIDGDAVQMFGIHSTQKGQCTFKDSGAATIKQYKLEVANAVEVWYKSSAITNPLTGNPITNAKVSNGATTAATMTILSLEDSAP